MTDYDTPNRATLNQVWDGIHQEKPFSPIPDNGLVRFTEHVQQQVHRNAPVLDLGCGRGRNSHFLSQIGFQVYGCDWSLLALKTANSHAPPENSISVNHRFVLLALHSTVLDAFAQKLCRAMKY